MSERLRDLYRLLPEALRMAILVKRRERIWLDRHIVFIHVPKAAGTSINLALYGRFMGHARALDVERWGSQQLRALPRFAVIRNPWDRLLSAYRFAKRGAGIGGNAAAVRKPQQYRVPEFESFERFVREWLEPRDVATLDGVFRPQWPYVCDADGRQMVEHLGRFEDLGPTFDYVSQRSGPIAHIPRINLSGESVNYRSVYTPGLASLVRGIYRQDVEAFGYEF